MRPFSTPAAGVHRALALSALLASPAPAQAPRNPQEPLNLLRDGSFENPALETGGSAGVTTAGAWSTEAGTIEVRAPSAPLDGTQCLELAGLAAVRQECSTRAAQRYSLSLAFRPRPEAGEVAFEVWYAGELLETIVVPPPGDTSTWLSRSYPVVGTSSRDTVELRSLEPSAIGVLVDDCWLMPYDPALTGQRMRNGNFEDDPRIDAGTSMENPVFVGWYAGQPGTVEVKDLGTAGNGASGKNVVDLDESGTVAQRLYVVPDQSYQLRFFLSPNPLDDRDRSVRVSFGGVPVATIAVTRSAAIAWSQRSYTVRSESPVAVLEFQDLGGGFDGALLDAVSLSGPVPEPETDGQMSSYSIIAHTPGAGIRLSSSAMFARGITSLGDLDGDGVQDLAIGSVGDDEGAVNAGAVWIAFLNSDRTVKGSAKISETRGGLVADFQPMDGFGRALSGIGDLDGDGIPDLVVGANEEDEPEANSGAAYVLFLNRNGTVRRQHKISALSGDDLQFQPVVDSEFGASIAGMGDVDGDGIPDVAIGARFSNSVQVCFLRRDGTVQSSTNLTYGMNGFDAAATWEYDLLGMSCANMGDFDGDGVNDLLIGAYGRKVAGMILVGGQYLLLLNRDGTCRRWFYYGSENLEPRTQTLGLFYDLGTACAGPGDIDGDGVRDIVVGAQREGALYDFGLDDGTKQGAIYVLLLNPSGTIKTCQRIGDRAGGWDYRISDGARWGESLAALGDHDGNGLIDIAVGSRFLFYTGAAFLCELRKEQPVPLGARFSGAPLSGAAPLLVTFTDLSTGPVTSWSWDFGDGTTSSLAQPTHSYASAGLYSVALTVGAGDGTSDTQVLEDMVNASSVVTLPAGVAPLGCGVNPPGSFRLLAGSPRIGTSMTFGVDNPAGTQAPGSTPMVIGSWNPDPSRPCGTLVAGLGMSAPGTNGERLIAAPTISQRTGSAWQGPGIPAPVVFPIPNSASLIGRTLYVQGRMLDGSAGAAIPVALATGFALTLQP